MDILEDIAAAVRSSDYDRAEKLANSAVAAGQNHPLLFKARGLSMQKRGLFREALTEFSRARSLSQPDSALMNSIGTCLINLNQPAEALRAFDTAIQIDSRNKYAHYRKAWTLEMLGERDMALPHFERAVEIDPDYADALADLAAALASSGKLKEAQPLAERALRINPGQASAIVVMGMVDLENRNFESAETKFRSVIETAPLTFRALAVVHGLLGDALDGQDRVGEAFLCYKFENNEKLKLYSESYMSQERPQQLVSRIAAFVNATSPRDWESRSGEIPGGGQARQHIFLLGFPRSGTTLLEQVLASHPDVVALEEREILADAAQELLASDAAMRRLLSLNDKDLGDRRSAYWRRVGDLGLTVADKVFVDKLPMNTTKLPLIAKLFPDSKILFALRDPRDVILSCFRRHFQLNAAMFEFLSLDDATDLYAAVMNLAVACREKLGLDFHDHRFEDMVSDFDGSIAAVTKFIGVEWSEAMRDFHRSDHLSVRSPSAAQIRRPLNADGVGQWRRYREQLAPVLPLLRPWAERFGYPAD